MVARGLSGNEGTYWCFSEVGSVDMIKKFRWLVNATNSQHYLCAHVMGKMRMIVLGIMLVHSSGGSRNGVLVMFIIPNAGILQKGKVTIIIQGGNSGVGGHV